MPRRRHAAERHHFKRARLRAMRRGEKAPKLLHEHVPNHIPKVGKAAIKSRHRRGRRR